MGVVVRRYIDILTIIITFPYSTCKNKNKKRKWRFLTSRGSQLNCSIVRDVVYSCYWKSAVEHDGGV